MKISQPTPELPVPNVRQAQEYYRDTLGFKIAWYNEEGRIGAVAHGDCAIFFRGTSDVISPSVFWVFTECVGESHSELVDGVQMYSKSLAISRGDCVSSRFAMPMEISFISSATIECEGTWQSGNQTMEQDFSQSAANG